MVEMLAQMAELEIGRSGVIHRIKNEMMRFFNRKYYKEKYMITFWDMSRESNGNIGGSK